MAVRGASRSVLAQSGGPYRIRPLSQDHPLIERILKRHNMEYRDSYPAGTTTRRPVRHEGPRSERHHHLQLDESVSDWQQDSPRLLTESLAHEELANALTHGFGLMLGLVGAVVLMTAAVRQGEPWLITGCGIYAATLIAVYAASTLSHVFWQPKLRHVFRTLDQSAIYLMIAGTYTPFALAYLCVDSWWVLLVAIWAAALAGFFSKMLRAHRVEAVSVTTYLVLGLLPLTAAQPILRTVPLGAIAWIVASVFCFLLGLVFFRLDEKFRYFHAAWHIMVIVGCSCQFVMILRYVASPHGG